MTQGLRSCKSCVLWVKRRESWQPDCISWSASLQTLSPRWTEGAGYVKWEICKERGSDSGDFASRRRGRMSSKDYSKRTTTINLHAGIRYNPRTWSETYLAVLTVNWYSLIGGRTWPCWYILWGGNSFTVLGITSWGSPWSSVSHICIPEVAWEIWHCRDPRDVLIDESAFAAIDMNEWSDFYGDVAKELSPRIPEPRGNAVDITCFVDANHAGNVITRRSRTGILIFVQNAPKMWWSKKQNTVKLLSFGSEFVALCIAKEMIVALRYKLRMFGVPLRGPASILCHNQGVVKNASLPESALSKRHNTINYHSVREAVAAGIIRVGKEDGNTNLADVFTMALQRPQRYNLFSKIGYFPSPPW